MNVRAAAWFSRALQTTASTPPRRATTLPVCRSLWADTLKRLIPACLPMRAMRLESAVRFHRLPRRLLQQGLIRRLHRVNDPAGEQVVVQGARDRRGQGDVSLLPSLRAMPFDLNRQVVSA